ncbi:hypothetical protein O181_036198 [Austropuccinia psidii MF-1]|uniref:Integrase catalytic domain-containing protein n=1 Tax=Austropuccinia psidii MF-1 TaxID=1389203 RepID=A0A9Q3D907_9BASI|nr:hypothetical protein [Austropuccinia psidii MF-1]
MTGDLINQLMIVTFNQPASNLTIAQQNWHLQLGHPSKQALKSLGLHPINQEQWDTCARVKMTLQPFQGHFTDVQKSLDCVHLNLVGPISPPSASGQQHILTIINQFTSYKITCFLKNKSDEFSELIIVKNLIETSQETNFKMIVEDRGGKFMNHKFKELTEETGIQHTFSPSYTPEHNGFSKRANRTILDKARCLLLTAEIPNQYWAEAVNTATILSNLIPTAS